MSARKKPCSCGRGHQRYGRCRKSRPLCRLRRCAPCGCDGYHYPHRPGSALCVENQGSADKRNELLYGRAR